MIIVRVMECIDWFLFFLFFFFLVALCRIQDLSSPTRDWTHAPCNPALGAQSFNHWATRELLDWFSQSIQATVKEHNTLGDMCTYSLGCVQLFVTPWAVAHQDPLSMGILQARKLEWIAMPSSRGSSQPRDRTQVSCIAGRFFTIWATREAPGDMNKRNSFLTALEAVFRVPASIVDSCWELCSGLLVAIFSSCPHWQRGSSSGSLLLLS